MPVQFAATPVISVKAETLFTVGGVSITNSHLLGLFGLIVLVFMLLYTRAAVLSKVRQNFMTRLVTWTFRGLYGTVRQVIPDEKWARRIAPLTITMFFFVIAQYYLGLLPVVGPIYLVHGGEHVPLFRGGVSDLNMTFALAFVTIIAAQLYAAKYLGFRGNLKRYFVNPLKDPIGTFVGLLELIAELSRLLSLSFRLFGNVFAGEVLILMIGLLSSYVSPIMLQPFYLFELFIGGIQAYIFFMLSTVFISLGLAHVEPSDHAHSSLDTKPVVRVE